jgi:hypothetical protein
MAAKLCNVCEKRRVGTTGEDPASAKHSDMCGLCYDEGGWENTHTDGNHDWVAKLIERGQLELADEQEKEEAKTMANCWICHPELNEAANWKPGKKGVKKAKGFRRPQLNHQGHSHPQIPAARRACKEAFWTMVKVTECKDVAAAMAKWDTRFDAYGKAVAVAPKPAKLHVAPLGPKGGVMAGAAVVKAKTTKKPLHPATPGSYEIVTD